METRKTGAGGADKPGRPAGRKGNRRRAAVWIYMLIAASLFLFLKIAADPGGGAGVPDQAASGDIPAVSTSPDAAPSPDSALDGDGAGQAEPADGNASGGEPTGVPAGEPTREPAGDLEDGDGGVTEPDATADSDSAADEENGSASADGERARGGSGGETGRRITMTFVGDVMLGSNVETLLKQHGFDYPYKAVADELRKADLTIANLETPITERGEKQDKQYAYRSSPEALPALKAAGIDLVNLANNHVLDYGETGLIDTFGYLEQEGIRYMGAGRNAEEAFSPAIVEVDGVTVAFFGFSRVVPDGSWKAGENRPGVADTYNHIPPIEAIERAREEADLVVVVAHWGIERQDTPEPYQIELAHRYIDAGADLVVGGHPHVLQGFEAYKGKWIAYSLGNFIFTTNDNPKTWETIILHAACLPGGGCELEAVPVLTKWARPEILDGEAGRKLLKRISGLSRGAVVDDDGRIRELTEGSRK